MKRRVGKVRAALGQLCVAWGRMEPDDDPALCYAYGGGGAHRGDVIFDGEAPRRAKP